MPPRFASFCQKNGRARRQARRRRASSGHDGPVGTAGLLIVSADRKIGPLPLMPAAGHGASGAIARSRQREEAFRVSSAVRPVAAGGRALGHQPHLPALSRRRPHGAQATGSEARRGRRGRRSSGESKPNARWSVDFVHDQLACGRRLRILNIVDDVTRECLAAIPDTSISGRRVARELTALIKRRGSPAYRLEDDPVDQGSEFVSQDLDLWAQEKSVDSWISHARKSERTPSARVSTDACATSF